MKNTFCWNSLKIIINVFPLDCLLQAYIYYCYYFVFLSLAVFRFNLNKLPFKWYKVPTMLLEKVSMHTEILFVQCYKFFFIITCSFSVFVENCILLPKGIQNVFVVFLGIVHLWFCYPFTQICIIGHKGTIFSQNSCKY
jgi:hypothetical protein